MSLSVFHMPEFPVIDAVGLSMSIPGLFRPLFIGKEVKLDTDEVYNTKYMGLYLDTDMLNPIPIHAMTKRESPILFFHSMTLLFLFAVAIGSAAHAQKSSGFYHQNSWSSGNVPDVIRLEEWPDTADHLIVRFKNSGDQPVRIILNKPSQGYMSPVDFSSPEISPGDSMELHYRVHVQGRTGSLRGSVVLTLIVPNADGKTREEICHIAYSGNLKHL